jgi:hypothetical protein
MQMYVHACLAETMGESYSPLTAGAIWRSAYVDRSNGPAQFPAFFFSRHQRQQQNLSIFFLFSLRCVSLFRCWLRIVARFFWVFTGLPAGLSYLSWFIFPFFVTFYDFQIMKIVYFQKMFIIFTN